MKYCILIIDGASGWPLPQHEGKTSLELAHTPNLDEMAQEGAVGLTQTIPPGMEPSSACACMSVLGYNPEVYYRGRSAIEARAMNILLEKGEVVFRCNLVSVQDGKMRSYSCGHINTEEARTLITSLNQTLGNDKVHFYPGISYRHICTIKDGEDTLAATCTPPHDIPGKPIDDFLPHGSGSELLRNLMTRSEVVLRTHLVNMARKSRGDIPATMVWLFWGSGKIPDMPFFKEAYGLDAALTSGVDLLRGLAKMTGTEILNIPGVSDNLDNNYAAQANGALLSLKKHNLVTIHVEAPDEAAHAGSIADKVKAIEEVDKEIVSRLQAWNEEPLRVLIMPDHATPIEIQTHVREPVPFLLWGSGFTANGAKRFTEAEAKNTGFAIEEGYNIMHILITGGD